MSVADTKRSSNKQTAHSSYAGVPYQTAMPVSKPVSGPVSKPVGRAGGHPGGSGNTRYPNSVYSKPAQKQQAAFSFVPAEGWLSLFLLTVAIYCVVGAIVGAGWILHSRVLFCTPVVGLLIGLVVAKTPRLPQGILHIAACLVGYWFAIWLTSAVAFHVNWLVLLSTLRAIALGGFSPTLIQNETDLVFFFYLAFLCYFLGYFGCWLIYRAHLPWLVALVYCSIMLVNLNGYAGQSRLYYLVVVMLGALLLLIARTQLTFQVQQWKRNGLYTDQDWMSSITRRCMQAASVITLLVLLCTVLLPVIAQPVSGRILWDSLDNAWNNVLNGRFSWQDLNKLTQPYQPPTNFFGDQLTITGSVHLPTGEVLFYTSTGGPRNLEGFTFNIFDGHTWTSSLTGSNGQAYDASASLPPDVSVANPTTITTTVNIVQPPEGVKHYVFAPAQPTAFDVPVIVYGDVTAASWTQQTALRVGEHYQVSSILPTADSQALSSIPLPANNLNFWQQDPNANMLSATYGQKPRDLSQNVYTLAKQWTAGAKDTYTALNMLEAHLGDQQTFTYSVDNAPIPANVDVVDWLLQTRKGYCTYYASAMAVMGRILGIPTRIVNGFSHGHLDKNINAWVVNGDDAHTWVQAYLPGYGWISFDPTPGFAPVTVSGAHPQPSPVATPPAQPRPTTTPTTKPSPTAKQTPTVPPTHSQGGPQRPSFPGNFASGQSLLEWFSGIVLFCSLLFLCYALGSLWWRRLFTNLRPIAGVFKRLSLLAGLAGLPPRSSQTPSEYGFMLSKHVPQASRQLWNLTQLFERELWGGPHHAPDAQQTAYAERLWRDLRTRLLSLVVKRFKK